MKIHQNISAREKPPCKKCGKIFYSHAAYKAHLKQHENPVPCDQCELTFISQGALKEHKQLVHKVSIVLTRSRDRDIQDYIKY